MDIGTFRNLADDVSALRVEQSLEASLQDMKEKVCNGAFQLKAEFANGFVVIKERVPMDLVRDAINTQISESEARQAALLDRIKDIATIERSLLCLENENESEPCLKTSSEPGSPSDTSLTKTTSKPASISTDVFMDITKGP